MNKLTLYHCTKVFFSFIRVFYLVGEGLVFFMAKEFYMTLSSKSDSKSHRLVLSKVVNFYKDWKVGLASLTLRSAFARSSLDRTILIKHTQHQENWHAIVLNNSSFESIFALISAINATFYTVDAPWKDSFEISFVKETRQLTLNVKAGYEVQLSGDISNLLDLPGGIILVNTTSFSFQSTFHYSKPHFSLLLNIIQESVVNSSSEKNLRTFHLNDLEWANGFFSKEFSTIHYQSVAAKHFSEIFLQLVQFSGESVDLENNDIAVILHFVRQ